MQYTKNTVVLSHLDTFIQTLRDRKQTFTLTNTALVSSDGLNDSGKAHRLRRLEYNDIVYREQFIRTLDTDTDDYIICKQFSKAREPKRFLNIVER